METPSTTTSTSSADPKTPPSSTLISCYRRPSSSRTIYDDRFIPSARLPIYGDRFIPLNCNIFKYKTETRKSLHSLSPFRYDDQLSGVSYVPVKAPRKVPKSPYKNPRPGVIINNPHDEDVYKGVPKDYVGNDVTAHNFFAVLLGDQNVVTRGSGKVVKSGPNDHIFVYFTDHGGPGVLDVPTLQDDFYLNLVDWSSHNVLAVGLGNCVNLWHASSSKVVKLCDLGGDDSVCSVG